MPFPVEAFPCYILSVHADLRNRAPVSVDGVRQQVDFLAKYHFAHRLFGAGTERLLLLRGVTKR
jgi:hypothetical protein